MQKDELVPCCPAARRPRVPQELVPRAKHAATEVAGEIRGVSAAPCSPCSPLQRLKPQRPTLRWQPSSIGVEQGLLPLHGRPTASVTRRARMQKPTQPMRLQSPGTRAILASQRVASEASQLAAAQTFSLETSRPTPPMLGARRAPVPAHAAASGTHASIRNRWDGRDLRRHHARRLLRRCKME